MAVGVPGTGGLYGIHIAAALGPFCNPEKKLTLFEDSNVEKISMATDLVKKGKINVNIIDHGADQPEIHIKIHVKTKSGVGLAVIRNEYINVVYVEKDGKVIFERKPAKKKALDIDEDILALSKMKLSEIIKQVENLSKEDQAYISKGIEMNINASKIGIEKGLGLGIAAKLQELVQESSLSEDLTNYAKIKTVAAVEARMSGYDVLVMSVTGSGNQGINVMLPIVAVAEKVGYNTERTIKAVALSCLVTIYATFYMGFTSVLCGAALKAGIGAAAGITYYLGGSVKQISSAIKNMAGNITGVICDGAKIGCAIKVATAAGTAIQSALLAMKGIGVPSSNGIVYDNVEDTIKNISPGRL